MSRSSPFWIFLVFWMVLPAGAYKDEIVWSEERQFWAFQAPKAREIPEVKNARWPRQGLDYFVLRKMEERGLKPADQADFRTLVRRATYDVTGLPVEGGAPLTPALSRGEREKWADALGVRVSPSGHRELRAEARTPNPSVEDYERLVDRLLGSPEFGERMASMWMPLARYAEDQAHQVGSDTKYFYPNAFKYREWVVNAFNRDLPYADFVKFQLAADKFENATKEDFAALGFLGLGPKYYNRNRIEVMADEWEDRVDTVTRTFLGLTVACARCHDHKFEPITREDYYAMAGVFASVKMVNAAPDGTLDKAEKQQEMAKETMHIVHEGDVQDLNVFIRGNPNRKGEVAPRGFIRLLAGDEHRPIKEGSGRKEIAEAIADPANPLAARVMVNRVWAHFFGKGLVETPSNFGHSGAAPSNRELLDYLAARFVAQGGSVKTLAREILLSATYRQSSIASAKALEMDPANEALSRMNRRRLTVEQWRDTVLLHSGELDRTGGKSLELDDPKNLRRTLYARVSRLELNSLLMAFDYPDANVHAEKRAVTTTATQKLFAMNSPFVIERAKKVAARLCEAAGSDEKRVEAAYRMFFLRKPDADERAMAVAFLRKPSSGEMTRLEQFAQSLLISNELMYVD